MQVLSFDAETAIFCLLELWPDTMVVIAARWFESDLKGEKANSWPLSRIDEVENESNPGIDQTWIVESVEPDKRKLKVGSAARHVVDWR